MSTYEPGSNECRCLIEAKDNLVNAMSTLRRINGLDHIQIKLRDVYNELEEIHEIRRAKEFQN